MKVINDAGITPPLRVFSPQALDVWRPSTGRPDPEVSVRPGDVRDRWLAASMVERRPLRRRLSGLRVEYRLLELYARDRGTREATLGFDVGAGTQDIGFRGETSRLLNATTCRSRVPRYGSAEWYRKPGNSVRSP